MPRIPQGTCRLRTPAALVVALAAAAWVRPEAPSNLKPVALLEARLDFVVMTVNGESHAVREAEELAVVRGDVVTVKEAVLKNPAHKAGEVNVVGYKSGKARRSGEDRGFSFSTDELKAKYSEHGKGEVFGVVVTTRGALSGTVYLRLIEPVLRYAELSLNGKTVVLRDGEAMEMSPTDMVKVEKVVTNLFSNADVTFQMVPGGDAKSYEIRFLRSGRPFAVIPLKVKGT